MRKTVLTSTDLCDLDAGRWDAALARIRAGHPRDESGTTYMALGRLVEPWTRKWARQCIGRCSWDVRKRWSSPNFVISAQCDGVTKEGNEPVEMKSVWAPVAEFKGWSVERNEIPRRTWVQVQVQMLCCSAHKAHVVVIVPRLGSLWDFVVLRDPTAIVTLIQLAAEFVRRHVQGDAPIPDDKRGGYVEATNYLSTMKRDEDKLLVGDPETMKALGRYEFLARFGSMIEVEMKQIRARLLQTLGGASGWSFSDKVGYCFTTVEQTRLDAKLVAQKNPDLYRECLRTSSYVRGSWTGPKQERIEFVSRLIESKQEDWSEMQKLLTKEGDKHDDETTGTASPVGDEGD